MTDEIRKVIAKEVDTMDRRYEDGRQVAGSIVEALHAAGYEIVPGWSDDLGAAPRDGTPINVYGGTVEDMELSGTHAMNEVAVVHWHSGGWTCVIDEAIKYRPTHWRPRPTPPKESE